MTNSLTMVTQVSSDNVSYPYHTMPCRQVHYFFLNQFFQKHIIIVVLYFLAVEIESICLEIERLRNLLLKKSI